MIRGASFHGTTDSGLTSAQLYSTASYQSGDLTSIDFDSSDLTGWSFAGQDLTDANFYGATLTDADFTNAEVRGADFGVKGRYRPHRGTDLLDRQLPDG